MTKLSFVFPPAGTKTQEAAQQKRNSPTPGPKKGGCFMRRCQAVKHQSRQWSCWPRIHKPVCMEGIVTFGGEHRASCLNRGPKPDSNMLVYLMFCSHIARPPIWNGQSMNRRMRELSGWECMLTLRLGKANAHSLWLAVATIETMFATLSTQRRKPKKANGRSMSSTVPESLLASAWFTCDHGVCVHFYGTRHQLGNQSERGHPQNHCLPSKIKVWILEVRYAGYFTLT